jgi:hypothetical protein
MSHPAFFDDVATIVLRDPLAELLGAAEGGIVEYGYAEAVKLAGHSCPTVAGAWLMNRRTQLCGSSWSFPPRGESQRQVTTAA